LVKGREITREEWYHKDWSGFALGVRETNDLLDSGGAERVR